MKHGKKLIFTKKDRKICNLEAMIKNRNHAIDELLVFKKKYEKIADTVYSSITTKEPAVFTVDKIKELVD